MFAVVQCGGKQYRVTENSVVVVERLPGQPGDNVDLAPVLMVGKSGGQVTVGNPVIEKAYVRAEIIEQSRDKKILVFKKQRRQNHRTKAGHRQSHTVLRVTDISLQKKKSAKTKTKKTEFEENKGAA